MTDRNDDVGLFDQTDLSWMESQTIPARIAALAQAHPQRLALRDHAVSLTYSELDQAANAVAQAVLAQRGIGQEAVALLVGVDAPAVCAALGVLKAGKIYVALEETFPIQRQEYILADCGARLILADEPNMARARALAGSELGVVQLESLPVSAPQPASPPDAPLALDGMAILNYTSGSTGKPKGVAQSHRSALAQAVYFARYYNVGWPDQVAFFDALAWAGTFWDIFGPLCLGASIAPFDLRRRGMPNLVSWLHTSAPSLVVGLTVVRRIAYDNPDERFPAVRLIHLGGDTIYRRDVEACRRVFPNALILVGIGTSEAGRLTEFLVDGQVDLDDEIMPLGFPAPWLQIRLLADSGEEVTAGEVGEMVVVSGCLAAGYWGLAELTAQKFRMLDMPGGGRAYFTGDLARQRPDGMLQHMGRKDYMVKIRGYQVYTNEIEELLLKVAGVRQACVIAHTLPDSAQRLMAYLVIERAEFPGIGMLHAALADLPVYMRPGSFVFLDCLPRTPNGKIDRQQLPLPEQSRLNVTAEYRAPQGRLEEQLAAIWGEVMGIEDLGVDDNYFELGGESLQSIRIIARVTELLGLDLALSQFFRTQTIAEMAEAIRTKADAGGL